MGAGGEERGGRRRLLRIINLHSLLTLQIDLSQKARKKLDKTSPDDSEHIKHVLETLGASIRIARGGLLLFYASRGRLRKTLADEAGSST